MNANRLLTNFIFVTTTLLSLSATSNQCVERYQSRRLSLFDIKDKAVSISQLRAAITKNQFIQGFILTNEGRRINVKFTPGDGSLPLTIALHGLGDKKESLDPLIKSLKFSLNVPVLSLDTNLSGESLKAYLKDNNGEIPKAFSYLKDVADITEIIQNTKAKKVFLLGHSKGGGLAYETSVKLTDLGVEVLGLIPMAPYAQDGFKYALNLMTNFNLPAEILQKLVNDMSYIPVISGPIADTMKPFIESLTVLNKQYQDLQAFTNIFLRFLMVPTPDEFVRPLMSPMLNDFMEKAYEEYFTEIARANLNRTLNEDDLNFIKKQVASAISLTNGLLKNDSQEALDLLDSRDLKISKNIPVLLMVGQTDSLVSVPLMSQLRKKFEDHGSKVTLYQVDGKGHFFPHQEPALVAKQIAEFMISIISKH